MTDAKLVQLQSQEEDFYKQANAMLHLTVAQLKERVASGEITRDEMRDRMSELFHNMASETFSEVLAMSESEPVFTSRTPTSGSNFQMTYRHKTIIIYLTPARDENDPYHWAFYIKPLAHLQEEFDCWHKYLEFPDVTAVKSSVMVERSVLKSLNIGKEGLLELLIDIDKRYRSEMATFESMRDKALKQMAIVQEKMQRVQEWNDRLRELAKTSEEKLKQLIADAEEGAWVWPEGKILTLFQIVWQTGCGVKDGIAYPDLTSAWSLRDTPDADGYFDLLPQVEGCNPDEYIERPAVRYCRQTRKVKPAFLVEIRKLEFASLEDLPLGVRNYDYLSIEAISFSELACRDDSGWIGRSGRQVEILASEGSSLEDFPGFTSREFYKHVFLGRTPIEEIRLALA